jgi:putative aldouronate transport system substrate-binding protein
VNLDQNKIWAPDLAPVNAQGVFSPKNEQVSPGGQVVLATCQYPEAIVKTMNLFDELNYQNPDFIDLYNKYFKPMIGTTDLRTNTPLRTSSLLAGNNILLDAQAINDAKAAGVTTLDPSTLDPRISGDKDLIQGALDYDNLGMGGWYALTADQQTDDLKNQYLNMYVGHWDMYTVGNLFLNGLANGTYAEKDIAFTGQTDSYADYWDALSSLQNTTYLQIMSGAASIDTFDSFVTQWKQQGGDTITAEVNKAIAP